MLSDLATNWSRTLILGAAVAVGSLLTTGTARAQKAKFQRTKPHVNFPAAHPIRHFHNTTRRRPSAGNSEWRYVPVRRFYNPPARRQRLNPFPQSVPRFDRGLRRPTFHRHPSRRSWRSNDRHFRRGNIRIRLKSYDH